ncbi:MAG: hypothetical protein GWN99_17530 [Gemmatimonadetes bacterium]|uniref:Uncharacterized protein n=1 Tax=Candidatus Kutchimonas denitrificans TaxID=3056748 RepID=A0AAE4ZBW3_9BACT|nr:hypothetical protein [Gemmatimonadota bacterium]NIR74650.1 hypothetical protein [Candidatus Kutchimonas denitrificans]NIS02840.1 hypothetical protein [Gemmatimonadota bacterium]NIT69001.1 hypothetical protein [Gemmatimonadota bacterium]NIU52306.1 hypothetical protein [Gemmatimonadota bacterium]
MALELRRWLVIVLGACALIAIAFLPPEPYERPAWFYRGDDHSRRLWSLLQQTRAELRTLELRDSLLSYAEAAPAGSGAGLVIAGDATPARKAEGRHLLERNLTLPEADGAGVTPVIGIEVDSVEYREESRTWAFGPRFTYFLPAAVDGGRCVAISHLRWVPTVFTYQSVETQIGRALGPCAYFSSFGPPGSGIADWLEPVDYMPASDAAWRTEDPKGPQPGPESDRALARGWRWPHLVACAAGNEDACRAGLTAKEAYWYRRDPRNPNVVRRHSFETSALGPRFDRYLSDLLIEMGEERFRRFWSSDAVLDAAFRDAFGLEMADWTMRWARAQVGRPRGGPLPSAIGTLPLLLIGGLVVAGSALWSLRRQVR